MNPIGFHVLPCFFFGFMALPWIVPSFYRVFFQLALSSFFLGCAVFDWCLFGGNEAKLRLLPSFAVVFFVCFFLPGFSMPDLTWFSLQAKRIRVAAVWAHLLVVTEFFCRVLSSIERGKTRLFFLRTEMAMSRFLIVGDRRRPTHRHQRKKNYGGQSPSTLRVDLRARPNNSNNNNNNNKEQQQRFGRMAQKKKNLVRLGPFPLQRLKLG